MVQDLSFLQDNIEQMGANIAALVCEGSSVLGGCEITRDGTNVSWTAGSVCIEGIIYKVEAGSLTSSSATLYWVVTRTDSERRKFKNESEHEVYRKFTCTLSDNTTSAYKYVEAERLEHFGQTLARRFSRTVLARELKDVVWNTPEGWSGKAYEIPMLGGKTIYIEATKQVVTDVPTTLEEPVDDGTEDETTEEIITTPLVVQLPTGTVGRRVQCVLCLTDSNGASGTTLYRAYNTSDLDRIELTDIAGTIPTATGVTAIITFTLFNLNESES